MRIPQRNCHKVGVAYGHASPAHAQRDSVRHDLQLRAEVADRLKRLQVESGPMTPTPKSDALRLADAVAGSAATAQP